MARVRRASRELIETSRELRRRQTPAESLLWDVLRHRETLGSRVRRQHAIGPYVLDFWIPVAKVAIEVDGSVHDVPEVAAYDQERTLWLEAQGIQVIRVSNAEVMNNIEHVITRILDQVQTRISRRIPLTADSYD